jgi:3-hydroxy acid dehydrogenase/malonic semialdehyde reductase
MIVLITGASAGFGESIAQRLCSEGHTVIATARRAEKLAATSNAPQGCTPAHKR